MKYLKYFENISPKELKKYTLYKYEISKEIEYYIDEIIEEIIEHNEKFLKYKMLYRYNNTIKEIKPNQTNTPMTDKQKISDYLQKVIYTSDNLKDCLNHLKLILKTNKYNI